MSYTQRMDGSVLVNVRSNMRKYLADDTPFCEHLLRDVPQALAQLDNQITEVERQIEEIRKQTKHRVAEMLDLKKFHAVRQFQESQAEKLEPLNNRITELNKVKKKIQDGLKADKARKQKQAKQEQAQKLEKMKTQYAREVGDINGYRTPTNLIKSIHDLFTALHGHSLQDKIQILLSMPAKAERLQRQFDQFEANGNAGDLLKPPTVNKELLTTIGFTRERVKGILGYDPMQYHLIFDEFGNGHLQRIEKNHRGGGGAALQKNLALQERQNQEARKQLIEEGLISK